MNKKDAGALRKLQSGGKAKKWWQLLRSKGRNSDVTEGSQEVCTLIPNLLL
jgi:hypothetical protein